MRTLRSSLLAGAAIALVAGPALAADMSMPAKAPYMTSAGAPSLGPWTGWYMGGQLGYGYDWSGVDLSAGSSTTFATLSTSPHGFTGGGHIGYDVQTGYLVFGIESSINGANFQGGSSTDTTITTGGIHNPSGSAMTNWWGDLNGRIGIAGLGNHVLPYLVGGLAYGGTKASLSCKGTATPCDGGLGILTSVINNTSVGWDAGAGIETRLNQNWSLFLQAKYVNLGSKQLNLGPSGGPVLTSDQKFQFGVVDGGFSYRF